MYHESRVPMAINPAIALVCWKTVGNCGATAHVVATQLQVKTYSSENLATVQASVNTVEPLGMTE